MDYKSISNDLLVGMICDESKTGITTSNKSLGFKT